MYGLSYLIALVLLLVPLYPKFPLVGVAGTFVAVRLEDIVLAAVVAWWGVLVIARRIPVKLTAAHLAILVYLATGAVATFSGIFLTKTAAVHLGLLHLVRRVEYMSVFFVAYSALVRPEQLRFLARVVLLVALVVATYGLGQQFLGWPVISTNNSEFSKGLALTLGPGARINSTFAGHYDLAAFSLFPLMLILVILTRPSRFRLVWAAVAALVYWAMLLSASRVTFAAFFITAAIMILLVRRRRWLVSLGILAAVSVFVSPQLAGRYKDLIVNHLRVSVVARAEAAVDDEPADALKPPTVAEDRSLNIRLKAEWPRAGRAFLKNPILGTGFSSVGVAVDNDYLRVLAETGAVGLTAFALVWRRLFAGLASVAVLPLASFDRMFVLAVYTAVGGLLITALFIDVLEASKVAIVTWTLLGLACKAKDTWLIKSN